MPKDFNEEPEFSPRSNYDSIRSMKGYELKEALYKIDYSKKKEPSTNASTRAKERAALIQELNRRGLDYDHVPAKALKDFNDNKPMKP